MMDLVLNTDDGFGNTDDGFGNTDDGGYRKFLYLSLEFLQWIQMMVHLSPPLRMDTSGLPPYQKKDDYILVGLRLKDKQIFPPHSMI